MANWNDLFILLRVSVPPRAAILSCRIMGNGMVSGAAEAKAWIVLTIQVPVKAPEF
jgi:hypothetical protein